MEEGLAQIRVEKKGLAVNLHASNRGSWQRMNMPIFLTSPCSQYIFFNL